MHLSDPVVEQESLGKHRDGLYAPSTNRTPRRSVVERRGTLLTSGFTSITRHQGLHLLAQLRVLFLEVSGALLADCELCFGIVQLLSRLVQAFC